VRLAFAVIVHVDADILIVDEALSVGDAFFTQKCMMRIKKLMDSGVTLLFVSHDSNSVKSLCTSALLLEHGVLTCNGDTSKVVEAYYGKFVQKQQEINLPSIIDVQIDEHQRGAVNLSLNDETFEQCAKFQRLRNGKADFLNVQLLNEDLQQIEHINFGQPVILRMVVRANASLALLGSAYHIRDKNGFDLVYSDTGIENCHIQNTKVGSLYVVDWKFSASLRQGGYTISAMLSIPIDMDNGEVEICDFVPIAIQFKVSRGEVLPIYGAVYWSNKVSCRPIGSGSYCSTAGERI
jgi:lipopolysaccharide transport system ATP-binding protein